MPEETNPQNESEQALQARVNALESQVVELQTQLSFQEQTIADLNGALQSHQQDMAALLRRWQSVEEQYESLQAQIAPGDQKPPHY